MATHQLESLNKNLSAVVKECFSKADKAEVKHMLKEGRFGMMELLGLTPLEQSKAA